MIRMIDHPAFSSGRAAGQGCLESGERTYPEKLFLQTGALEMALSRAFHLKKLSFSFFLTAMMEKRKIKFVLFD